MTLWRSLIPLYYERGRKRGYDLQQALRFALDRTTEDIMESFS